MLRRTRPLATQLRRIAPEFTLDLLPGHCIGTPAHLFSRLDDKEAERLRKKYAGTADSTVVASATEAAAAKAKSKHAKGKPAPGIPA